MSFGNRLSMTKVKAITRTQDNNFRLSLSYAPPFDFEGHLAYYRSHQVVGVEDISSTTYERAFRVRNTVGFVRVFHDCEHPQLNLDVTADDPSISFVIAKTIRKMFDLDLNFGRLQLTFAPYPFLLQLLDDYLGFRLASAWDPFENAVSTILGQLVSVGHARLLTSQIVDNYGDQVVHPRTGTTWHLFPSPEVLAKSDLQAVKTTRVRRRAIQELARLCADGQISLLTDADTQVAKARMSNIPGIGRWTMDYLALRGLGETDAFPATDLLLKRAIQRHPEFDLESLRPLRAYLAVYLWRHYSKSLSRPSRAANPG
jgi:AraC family transcriptional regulator of adaptative response / DNA-3-methyladenine glycosylase II